MSKTKNKIIEGFHPQQHIVNVVMTDGTKFQIMTTWGKEGDTLKLDVDPKNHPAWQDKAQSYVDSNNTRLTEFRRKFGGFEKKRTESEVQPEAKNEEIVAS